MHANEVENALALKKGDITGDKDGDNEARENLKGKNEWLGQEYNRRKREKKMLAVKKGDSTEDREFVTKEMNGKRGERGTDKGKNERVGQRETQKRGKRMCYR